MERLDYLRAENSRLKQEARRLEIKLQELEVLRARRKRVCEESEKRLERAREAFQNRKSEE